MSIAFGTEVLALILVNVKVAILGAELALGRARLTVAQVARVALR